MAKSKIFFGIILISILVLSMSFASAGIFDFLKNLFNGGGITGNPIAIESEAGSSYFAFNDLTVGSYLTNNNTVRDKNGVSYGNVWGKVLIFSSGIDGLSARFRRGEGYIYLSKTSKPVQTISFWAKSDSTGCIPISSHMWGDDKNNFVFALSPSINQAQLWSIDSWAVNLFANVSSVINWNHYTIINNNSLHQIYVNGVLKASYSGNSVSDNYPIAIGSGHYSTFEHDDYYNSKDYDCDGYVDEVLIYDRVLFGSEIYSIYNEQLSRLSSGSGGGGGGNNNQTFMNGECGSSLNTCNKGTINDLADSSTEYLWECLGINGGTNAACSYSKGNNQTINGICGTEAYSCAAGTLANTSGDYSYYYWNCIGSNGGTSRFCQSNKNQTNSSLCSDSDNGLNYSIQGNTTGIWDFYVNPSPADISTHYDSCLYNYGTLEGYPKAVSEYYCNANSRKSSSDYICQGNDVCINGACKPIPQNNSNQTNTCTDSDGGINYDVRGNIIIKDYLGNIIGSDWDDCGQEEFYCNSNGSAGVDLFPLSVCPNGCSDGACLPSQNNSNQNLTCTDTFQFYPLRGEEVWSSMKLFNGEIEFPLLESFAYYNFDYYDFNKGYEGYVNATENSFIAVSHIINGEYKSYIFRLDHISSDYYDTSVTLNDMSASTYLDVALGEFESYDDLNIYLVYADEDLDKAIFKINSSAGQVYLDRLYDYKGNYINLGVSLPASEVEIGVYNKDNVLIKKYLASINNYTSDVILVENNCQPSLNLKCADFGYNTQNGEIVKCNSNATGGQEYDLSVCSNVSNSCADPDGFNPYFYSSVYSTQGSQNGPSCEGVGSGGGGGKISKDTCKSSNILSEAICIGDLANFSDYLCENGCGNGACVNVTNTCENGCSLNGKCVPIGYRKGGDYCDIDGNMKNQRFSKEGSLAYCDNNFECDSNLCSSGSCVPLQDIITEAKGFRVNMIKLVCRISSTFNFDETYEQCIANALEGNVKAPMSCIDSDGGLNYDTLGIISGVSQEGSEYTKEDFCQLNVLQEYSCTGKESTVTGYECPYGCSNGECLKQPEPVNGICGTTLNTCVAGTFEDHEDSSTEYLWECNGIYGGVEAACSLPKPAPLCIDSDGGLNYYFKGNATGYDPSVQGYLTMADHCFNDFDLNEIYCAGDYVYQRGYKCPGLCSNGACINVSEDGIYDVRVSMPTGGLIYSAIYSPNLGYTRDNKIYCGNSVSNCTYSYDYNSSVILISNPLSGYVSNGWQGDCYEANGNICFLNLDSDKYLGASFIRY